MSDSGTPPPSPTVTDELEDLMVFKASRTVTEAQ
jgi:hypothetical protein